VTLEPDPLDAIFNVPILFGLRAQGHLPTIKRMLTEGHSWDDIGQAIGWMPDAAQQAYERELNRQRRGED